MSEGKCSVKMFCVATVVHRTRVNNLLIFTVFLIKGYEDGRENVETEEEVQDDWRSLLREWTTGNVVWLRTGKQGTGNLEWTL